MCHTIASLSPPRQPSGELSTAAVTQRFSQAMASTGFTFTWLSRRPDHSEFYAEITLSPVGPNTTDVSKKDAMGNEPLYVAIIRDTTERMRRQIELEEQNAQNRYLTSNANVVLWILDAQTLRFTYVSEGILKQRGFTPEEMMATPFDDVINPEQALKIRNAIATRLERILKDERDNDESTPHTERLRQPCKDGRWIWTEVVTRFVRNPRTGRIEIHGATLDVTQTVIAENALNRTREYLETVVDAMPSALIAVDDNLNITQWNRHAAIFSKIDATHAIGKTLQQVWPEAETVLSLARATLESRQSESRQNILVPMDDTWRYVNIVSFPVTLKNETGAVIRIDDVTEPKMLQDVLVKSEQMMSLGGMAAGMAHEINNPLGGITQYTQVIKSRLSARSPANAQIADKLNISMTQIHSYTHERQILEMLDGIDDAAQRAGVIIRGMLDYARQSPSKMTYCSISDLFKKTILLARNDFDARRNIDFLRLDITVDVPPNLPAFLCDFPRMQQVLLNLFKNSTQALATQPFTPGAWQLTLRARLGDQVMRIEVEDNGPGIPASLLDTLFSPFVTSKGREDGTGLGLSICKFIVENQHRGHISVLSKEGEFTRFIIELPFDGNNKAASTG